MKKRKAEEKINGGAAAVAGLQAAMPRGPRGVPGEQKPILTGAGMPWFPPTLPPGFPGVAAAFPGLCFQWADGPYKA